MEQVTRNRFYSSRRRKMWSHAVAKLCNRGKFGARGRLGHANFWVIRHRLHSLARGVPKVDVKRTSGTTVSNSMRDAPGSRGRGWREGVLTLTDVTSLYHGTRLPPRWEETCDTPQGNSSYWHSWNSTVTCYRVMRKACGSFLRFSFRWFYWFIRVDVWRVSNNFSNILDIETCKYFNGHVCWMNFLFQ